MNNAARDAIRNRTYAVKQEGITKESLAAEPLKIDTTVYPKEKTEPTPDDLDEKAEELKRMAAARRAVDSAAVSKNIAQYVVDQYKKLDQEFDTETARMLTMSIIMAEIGAILAQQRTK